MQAPVRAGEAMMRAAIKLAPPTGPEPARRRIWRVLYAHLDLFLPGMPPTDMLAMVDALEAIAEGRDQGPVQ